MDQRKIPWIKLLLAAVVAAAMVAFLSSIGEVVELLLVSALLAYLLDPIARWLEAHGLSRTLATATIFVALLLGVGAFLGYLFPLLAGQLQAIQQGVNVARVEALVGQLERRLVDNLAFLGVRDLNLMETLQGFIARHLGDVVNYVPSVFLLLVNLVVIPFIVFFLLKDGRAMKKGFVSILPNRYFEFALNVMHKMDVQLGNYLRGQVLDALIVGILSILALWLLGVEYYVLIGAFAGITNLVPYVGPIVGGTLAVLVSLATGGELGHAVAIVFAFIGIQVLDNAMILPLVVARNVELHPLLILLVVIIGGNFFGVLGLLLAVPATAVAKVMLVETFANLRRYRLA